MQLFAALVIQCVLCTTKNYNQKQ